jgi:hypothetical protein
MAGRTYEKLIDLFLSFSTVPSPGTIFPTEIKGLVFAATNATGSQEQAMRKRIADHRRPGFSRLVH